MNCPSCKGEETTVLRTKRLGGAVVRTRSCADCGRRFCTRETVIGSESATCALTAATAIRDLLNHLENDPAFLAARLASGQGGRDRHERNDQPADQFDRRT